MFYMVIVQLYQQIQQEKVIFLKVGLFLLEVLKLLMLQQEKSDTYVLATNETHSIREFVEEAGKTAGFDIEWQGEGINELGVDKKTGKTVVKVNPEFYRPAEVEVLLGNPRKAENTLGWHRKVSFADLAKMMMEKDIERSRKGNL